MRAYTVDLRHMEHTRCGGELYIACADWNFAWTPGELVEFKRLWRGGVDLLEMAERLRRPDYEVALLLVDLAERGEIGGARR